MAILLRNGGPLLPLAPELASGGTYTLKDGNYQEFAKYAAFDGFEKMKVNYKLTIKDGKLHTIGTIGGPEIYEELFERVDW